MGYAVSSSDSQTAQRLGWSMAERLRLASENFHPIVNFSIEFLVAMVAVLEISLTQLRGEPVSFR